MPVNSWSYVYHFLPFCHLESHQSHATVPSTVMLGATSSWGQAGLMPGCALQSGIRAGVTVGILSVADFGLECWSWLGTKYNGWSDGVGH